MKIKVGVPGVEEVELPQYDYKKIREMLEKLSKEYRQRSERLEELRAKTISPFAGFPVMGDPFVGRPTLTPEAPVFWYRSLVHVGMRNFLRNVIGEVVDNYLYRAGRTVGESLVKEGLIERKENLTEQIKEIHEKIKSLKIGVVTVLTFKEDYAQIRVDECISCAGQANIGETTCFWEGGVIAGILSTLLNAEVETVEYKCWGNGDQTCEFDVFIGKDASKRAEQRRAEIRNLLERGERNIRGLGVET